MLKTPDKIEFVNVFNSHTAHQATL